MGGKVGKSGNKWIKMNFRGRSQRNLDPKGRLMLSPEYRESLFVRMKDTSKTTSSHNPQISETTTNNTTLENTSPLISTEIETKLVITTYDDCLVAYPWYDWIKLEEQFTRITNPSPSVRNFRRLFIGGAEEHTLDAQGRIRLSQEHRDYAKLEKEVTVLGLTNRFEIWNPTLLKQRMEAESFESVSDELNNSGIDFAL